MIADPTPWASGEGLQQAWAPATRRVYHGALRRLSSWVQTWRAGQPLTDMLLSDYLAICHAHGAAPATIDQVVAAVAATAMACGEISPVGAITRRRRRACRRSGAGRGRGQAVGVDWRAADRIVDQASREDTLAGRRDAAIVAIGSDALLRVSEIAELACGDVSVASTSATVMIARSKTDLERRGSMHSIGPETARALQRWMTAAQLSDGPLFRRIWRGGTVGHRSMAPASIARMIAARARAVGVTGRVTGHSLRIGAAQSMADAGATTLDLMLTGRWASERMPVHYARLQIARRDAVARLRYGARE